MNEFNECVHEVFSAVGDIIIKSMMGGYPAYQTSLKMPKRHQDA